MIKSGAKKDEQIEFYRRKNPRPSKYVGDFFGQKIYFRNTNKLERIKKYSGTLLDWDEKHFKKFVKNLDFELLSAAMDDFASKPWTEFPG